MSRLIYLSHPQVTVEPARPVSEWGLSPEGKARLRAAVGRSVFSGVRQIVSSRERKAMETAALIAGPLGLTSQIRDGMGEIDRSATGYLPPAEFEATADDFFAAPDRSIRGWERARDAQGRIVTAVEAVLAAAGAGDLLCVGHGAVGTLLMCRFGGLPISRRHDQPEGGGHLFAVSPKSGELLCRWTPLESWSAERWH